MKNKTLDNIFQSPDTPIKIVIFNEPTASLMLRGRLDIKNFNTAYRGYVLITVAKNPRGMTSVYSTYGHDNVIRMAAALKPTPIQTVIGSRYLGKAIAIGKLVDCRPMEPADSIRSFIDYEKHLYAHEYEEVIPIEPIEITQRTMLSDVSKSVRRKIKAIPSVKNLNNL